MHSAPAIPGLTWPSDDVGVMRPSLTWGPESDRVGPTDRARGGHGREPVRHDEQGQVDRAAVADLGDPNRFVDRDISACPNRQMTACRRRAVRLGPVPLLCGIAAPGGAPAAPVEP
jgi:hypothetical protein